MATCFVFSPLSATRPPLAAAPALSVRPVGVSTARPVLTRSRFIPAFRPTPATPPCTPRVPAAQPRASAAQSSSTPTSRVPSMAREIGAQLASLALIVGLQRVVGLALSATGVVFPAPLAAMLFVLLSMSALRAARMSKLVDRVSTFAFSPAVGLLTRWLPVFFVPNLVMLPLAPQLPAADLSRLLFVVPLLFFATLVSTALVCVALRALARSSSNKKQPPIEQVATKALPPSNTLISSLVGVATAAFAVCAATGSAVGVAARLYAVATTLLSFSIAQRFPARVKMLLHPLIACTTATIASIALLGAATGTPFAAALGAYYVRGAATGMLSGAGNLLAFLLGPAVITLAFTVDRHRRLARARVLEVCGASAFIATASLLGTAAAARTLGFSPATRLLLVPRTITAPLAVPIAGLLGADVRLAASIVAVTGVLGANLAKALLSALKVRDPVVRGLAVGASAHGLGTAAMSDEGAALPFSALAMTGVGVVSTVLVAYSPFRLLLLRIALGAAGVAAL